MVSGAGEESEAEVITCTAAVVWEAGQLLSLETIQVAPPQAKEVRIKITHTSLCHTDIYFWKGKLASKTFWGLQLQRKRSESLSMGITVQFLLRAIAHVYLEMWVHDGGAWFPRILGHEGAGVVESVGSEVAGLKPGDHVIPSYAPECRECEICMRGKRNVCEVSRFNFMSGVAYSDKKCRFSISGKPVHHFFGLSTFSEYTVVHSSCVAKVNPEAPLDTICLLGCGVSAGFGAAWNVGKVKPGDSVAVFGLGTIGLATAEGARIAGATTVLGIDIDPRKEEISKRFGVTEFLNPSNFDKPVQEVIKEMTNGGVDSSYECVGKVEIMLSVLQSAHPVWGRAVILGIDEIGKMLCFSPLELHDGRKLKLAPFGGFKVSDVPKLVDKFMNNEFDLHKYVTQRMEFSDINTAFQMLLEGKCLRCVLQMKID